MYETQVADGPQWAEEQWLGSPTSGEFNMGDGVSTSQLQNPNVTVGDHKPRIAGGPPWQQSLMIFFIVVGVLAVVKFVIEKAGGKGEFASIRIGLESWFVVGSMAALFFYAAKTSVGAWKSAPGALKQFVGAI